MAKSKTTERDEQHELSRRALIKWSLAAGAALGVSRSGIAEVLNKTVGPSMAYASDNKAHRYVGIYMGVGALAWSTLLWPFPEIAGTTGNDQLSFHKLNTPNLAPAGTNRPLWLSADSPFQNLPASRQMTGFLCGSNNTHDNDANSTSLLGPNKLFAAITAIQSSLPSVVPAIRSSGGVGNGPVSYGTAPGAAAVSTVNSSADIVNLFNSAASSAGGLLVNTNDAALYKQTYQSFAGLVRASGRSTNIKAYQTASTAAGFLGTNLASQLEVKPEDLVRYGITGATRGAIAELGRLLIVTVKAFKLGLTNSVLTNLLQDDPHGAFANMPTLNSTVLSLKNVFDGFMGDLKAAIVDGEALDNKVVMSIHGDTFKNPRARDGWGDGTSNNSNQVLVLGGGHIKTGHHGRYTLNGNIRGFNPETGEETDNYNGALQAQAACSAIAFAVAGGDERRVGDFSNGASYAGLVNPIAV